MTTYHLAERDGGTWAIIRPSAVRATSLHPSREDALSAVRALVSGNTDALLCPQCERGETHEISPAETAVSVSTSNAQISLAERIGQRLKRARLMRGHSLRSLSKELASKISHTTLQNIEKGKANLDTEMLGLLAGTFDVAPDYFLKPPGLQLTGVEYRKQNSKLSIKAQAMVEEQAFEFFERYLEAEALVGVSQPPFKQADLSTTSVADLPEAIERAAEALRLLWKLGENPIPNVHAMLEEHGVKVKFLEYRKGFDGFSAYASNDDSRIPVMALGKTVDLPRLRFSALHELGHLAMKLPPGLEQRAIENACHRFAAAFLIPMNAFKKAIGDKRASITVQELVSIKSTWGISIAAAVRRAKDLEIISASRFKGYCIATRKKGWHKPGVEPGNWTGGDERSSRLQSLVLRALSEDYITTSKACGLLDISHGELSELSAPLA